ncbi:MAG: undecaprenyl-phosphate alpha-N-acetylglucosaminyltransferase, partial [Candidatus Daviesbacteria bacterium GW2011_GWC1_40_9]
PLFGLDKHFLGIATGAGILTIVGILDDRLDLNPYLRLFTGLAAALCVVAVGIGIAYITNPVIPGTVINLNQPQLAFELLGKTRTIWLVADLFATIWILWTMNIVNWSKGVDGQMPGITLVAALVLGLISLKFYFQGDSSQLNNAKLAFLVAGTSAGFLIFNWYPSKIMPAFSGSTILAFMLATLSILSTAKVATAILVLAVPMADFVYTFFRRILSGRSPVWNDRGHLHHRLLDLGWSHQKISLFYIFGSAMFGMVALLVSTESKFFVIISVAAIFLGFIIWLNSLGGLSKPHGPNNG